LQELIAHLLLFCVQVYNKLHNCDVRYDIGPPINQSNY